MKHTLSGRMRRNLCWDWPQSGVLGDMLNETSQHRTHSPNDRGLECRQLPESQCRWWTDTWNHIKVIEKTLHMLNKWPMNICMWQGRVFSLKVSFHWVGMYISGREGARLEKKCLRCLRSVLVYFQEEHEGYGCMKCLKSIIYIQFLLKK